MTTTLPQLLFGASFGVTCWTLLVLPFAPAWHEWRNPSDSTPLPIPTDDADDAAGGRGSACELHLHANSVAPGHFASRARIVTERGCCFLSLHAPIVEFGRRAQTPGGRLDAVLDADLRDLPGAVQRAPDVWRIRGDCRIPAGRSYTGSLVVTGALWIGEASRIEGSVKAYCGIILARAAVVTGAIVCPGAVLLEPGAIVGGPLVSETDVLLCTGAHIGFTGSATTLSASRIVVEEGACAHGSVRAREAGVVIGAST